MIAQSRRALYVRLSPLHNPSATISALSLQPDLPADSQPGLFTYSRSSSSVVSSISAHLVSKAASTTPLSGVGHSAAILTTSKTHRYLLAMDPLSFYSAIFSITETSANVVRLLRSATLKSDVNRIFLEASLHAHSMTEIKDMLALMQTEMPSSARSCLQICHETIEKLNKRVGQLVQSPRLTLLGQDKDISDLVDRSGRCIAMLRSIVTRYVPRRLGGF